MPKVTLRNILDDAIKRDYALGSFAVNNIEQIHGLIKAAKHCKSPLIIMISKRSLAYSPYLPYLLNAASLENPGIPIVVHLDHSNSFLMCKKAIDFGFSSVMIDGTITEEGKPSSFEYNMEITKKVVDYAHKRGVSVEGELGQIAGKEEDQDIDIYSQKYTDPLKVKEFVDYTGVDALAVSIGNSHGLNKFKSEQTIRLDILSEIHNKIPNIPLVLHGASCLDEKYVRKILKYRGNISEIKGLPINQIKNAIKLGIKKVNIYNDIVLCMIATIREYLYKNPNKIDPRQYLGCCIKEIANMISERMNDFNSVNKF